MRNLVLMFFALAYMLNFWGCNTAGRKEAIEANNAAVNGFTANFNDAATLRQDWIVDNGEWKIEDGKLIGEGYQETNPCIWLNKPLSDNVEIEYVAEALQTGNDLNCIIAGNTKSWSGYPILIGGYGGTRCRIGIAEIRNEDEHHHRNLRETPYTIEAKREYTVNVRRMPDRIIVSIDGEEIMRSERTELTHTIENQFFGFFSWDNRIAIKKLTIKDLRG